MKRNFSIILFSFVFVFGMISNCNDDDDNSETPSNCDQETILSSDEFVNAAADPLIIESLEIDNACLQISFYSSGCDGSTWDLKLIDSGAILESDPPQRNLRLSLLNLELCDAVISKTISFDVSDLQVEGTQVYLNIVNSGDQILYTY
ncbi:hypothetical protein [Mangrovimonas xylaniphaga]|uniref:hypothetical protein n=1 Tax=Mangrovimonas xylaniphaga TaxID=1645915 RepID=UPI000A9C42EA|nr:hypothetical protein [Mangrovimonas xylaniphaga]